MYAAIYRSWHTASSHLFVLSFLQRACAVAKVTHDAIPQELKIKEVFVTKGLARKHMTIMGRGRTGFGYIREAHVTVSVEKIDFPKFIAEAKTVGQKRLWTNRYAEVQRLKNELPVVSSVTASV